MRSLRASTDARLFAARSLLALGLALASFAAAAPAGGAYAAGACAMHCCRSRLKAACPSCRHNRPKKSDARPRAALDPVCGARADSARQARSATPPRNAPDVGASADAGSAYAPCPSDCCGLLASPNHPGRDRDYAAASRGVRPTPSPEGARAAGARRADADNSELRALCSPRAPPQTLRQAG